jgi:hypothetical protein
MEFLVPSVDERSKPCTVCTFVGVLTLRTPNFVYSFGVCVVLWCVARLFGGGRGCAWLRVLPAFLTATMSHQ